MSSHLIIFILAVLGFFEAIYLLIQRKKGHPPVCVIGGSGCATVWESPYSRTCGVGNEVLGLIFYATISMLEGVFLLGFADATLALSEWVLLLGGAVMSCYYVYLQWRVICAWCFWCTVSAVIVWVMLLVRILLG